MRAGLPGRFDPRIMIGRQMRAAPAGCVTVEGAASAEHALRSTVAAMQAHQFLHQRQADAGAFLGAAALALDAVEALEQARQLLRGECPTPVSRTVSSHAAVVGWAQRSPSTRPRR